MAQKASKELFDRILRRLHSESLPYAPPIYPPEAAWEKIGKHSIVAKAWKKAAKLKGQIDL